MTDKKMTHKQAKMSIDSLPTSRAEALLSGEPYYFTHNPCCRGHLVPRRTSDYTCTDCLEDRKNSPVYVLNDKPKSAERQAASRARRLGLLPDDYDRDICLEYYKLAAVLTERTGVRFEVDHNIPLNKKKGGYHHQENLLVMVETMNRKKGSYALYEVLLKDLAKSVRDGLAYGNTQGEFIGEVDRLNT